MKLMFRASPLSHCPRLLGLLLFFAALLPTHAQRQMERLGRGVVVLRTGTTSFYAGWRLLATDPENVGFNLYRVPAGGAAVKLNSSPLTNTTDFAGTIANFSVSNAWFVCPVVGTNELAASAPFGLPANPPTRQYLSIPLQPVAGGAYPPYDVKFCWVGDLDGDGEYDFVVDRLSTTTASNQYLQAYKRDGTFLWQVDMGFNSTNQYAIEPGSSAISVGMGDHVTVFDMDGDGRAEVLLKTANGVVLPGGVTVTAADNTTQFISVLDGLTGAELARATIPNPYSSQGPLSGHFGIMYCDGVRPSLVFEGDNRNADQSFNLKITTWDYRNGALTQRWTWDRGSQDADDFHQIRIADVDHDGKDELCEGSYVIDDNGQLLFTTELIHGDRFHITDMDPDRPGLETFAIQQDNPTMLGMALYESGTGRMIKKWYQTGVGDVSRGVALDLDPRYKGVEMYSTMGGIYNCKGALVSSFSPWAPEGLWWDADLLRETIDGAGSGAYSPVVNKFDYTTGGFGRLYSIYSEGVHQSYGGRSAFWGDILGDWREELILVANDYSELRIYTTKLAATNRLVTLMHAPAYRGQATCKGYYQASYPDFYLGQDMPTPVPAPFSDATLVWRGGAGTNHWDASITLNWRTNWFWSTNTARCAFNPADTVLFDLTGSNAAPVNLVGTLTPGAVRVYAPKNYAFSGDGSLSGPMKLTKAGKGALTLNTTNDFTGATLVAEGPLVVNGALTASPVTVRGGVWHDGQLCGSGFVGGGVRIEIAGGISPGNGSNSPGTLTVSNGVVFAGGTENYFDLTHTPSGPNDLLDVIGNLTLNGTNDFRINPLAGSLAPGTYRLITYSGALSGSITAQTVSGLPGVPVALTNPPGQIALVVKPVRSPTTLSWAGGLGGNSWDVVTTSNWWNGAARDQFNPQDTVRFDNSGATNPTAVLSGVLNFSGVVVDSSSNYTFGGSGVLMGAGGLAKSNSGTLTISGSAHTYTGPTTIAGGVLSVVSLNVSGSPSSIGASGVSATNLVLAGGTLQLVGDDSYTDRNVTLGGGTSTLEIPSSSVQLTLMGQVSGSGRLAKTGSGLLLLNAANTYTGGTTIKAGRILLGSVTANVSGLGSGATTLEGGTLSMSDLQASETAAWNLVVPTNASARLDVDGRCTLNGSLTGGGTLNFFTPFSRTDLGGNWSAFTGQINVITDTDGGDFRIKNSTGFPAAALNLATNVTLYSILSGNPSISIGELWGAIGSSITPSTLGGNAAPTAFTLRVGGRNTDATFAGTIDASTASVTLIKEGTGTWTLTGTNSYTGTTSVNAGTLLVNGDHSAAPGSVTIAPAGTLGGKGIIGAATLVNGRLSPGASIGSITFANNVTLNAGSTTFIEIAKSPLTDDLFRVFGKLTYGGTLVVTNLTGTLAAGDSFQILSETNSVGAFAGMSLPALATNLAWDTTTLYSDGTLRVVLSGTSTNTPPTLAPIGNKSVVEGDTLAFIATATDPESPPQTLNFSLSSGAPAGASITTNGVFSWTPGATTGPCTNAVTVRVSDGLTAASETIQIVVVSALLAHYPFDETGGTIAADASGNGYTAALNGGAAFASGYRGNALDLNGTNGFVRLPADFTTNLNSFTVMTWLKLDTIANWQRIFDFGNGQVTNMFLTPRAASAGLRFAVSTNGNSAEQRLNAAALPTGSWKHVAVTIAGTNGLLYVDGVAVATNSTMTLAPAALGRTSTNYLGRSQYADPYPDGKLDDFRIYRRALSLAEIRLASAGLPFDSRPVMTSATLAAGGLAISGGGGTPAWQYVVLASTNLALPAGSWSPVKTNLFDLSGNFAFTNAPGAGAVQEFYRLMIP